MWRLSKITRARLSRADSSTASPRFFASNSREDKPFSPNFNRAIRNQKSERDENRKPPVDWSADQSFFPGARNAIEKKQQASTSSSSSNNNKSESLLLTQAPSSDPQITTAPSEPTLPAADATDPTEKPSHGALRSVYVTDQHTLESKGITSGMKQESPEDDPLDKSIQWEDFKRDEIYRLLRHMDSFKGQTTKHGNAYMGAYTIYEDAINKADFPYLHHLQEENEREIGAASDDDLDMMLTQNRKLRLADELTKTYDQFLDEIKLTNKYPPEEIEEERQRYHQEEDERLRLLRLREPPLPTPHEYQMATRKKAIWNLKDPRLDDLIPPAGAGKYTYEDWEHELRRGALSQILETHKLPPKAEKALNLKWEQSKKPSVLGVPEQLSKYVNLGSTLKPLKEFHQKMLRIYGSHYELGEPRPPIPMDEQLEAGIAAAVMNASDWVEPNRENTLQELEALRVSYYGTVSDDAEMEEESRDFARQLEGAQREQKGQSEGEESAVANSEAEEVAEGDTEQDFETGMKRAMRRDEDEEELDENTAIYREHEDQVRKEEASRLKRRWNRGYKEPRTVAAYMKLLDEIEAPKHMDVNFMNMTQTLNAMGKYPDPRYSLGNEADLQPDMPDTEEYLPQPKDKRKIKDTHLFPIKLEDWEKLKFETKQSDEMPKELRTFFNPQVRRGNEEERQMLENLDPGMQLIGAHTSIPSPFPQPRVFHLDSDVKEAIWRFNRMDPRKYHSRKLAAMFGLSLVRVQSVLRLQYLEEQIAQEIGYDSELEIFENEVEEEYEVQPAQWDPDFFNELKKHGGNFSGRQEYVDEGDLAILKKIERNRISRYWNEYETEILLEQNSRKHAYGALDNPLPPPVQLSNKKNPKQRYPVVMTEIGDRENGNFRIAVRDKQGVLREPDDTEFKRVRRRERGAKWYFNHVPYQFGETI